MDPYETALVILDIVKRRVAFPMDLKEAIAVMEDLIGLLEQELEALREDLDMEGN